MSHIYCWCSGRPLRLLLMWLTHILSSCTIRLHYYCDWPTFSVYAQVTVVLHYFCDRTTFTVYVQDTLWDITTLWLAHIFWSHTRRTVGLHYFVIGPHSLFTRKTHCRTALLCCLRARRTVGLLTAIVIGPRFPFTHKSLCDFTTFVIGPHLLFTRKTHWDFTTIVIGPHFLLMHTVRLHMFYWCMDIIIMHETLICNLAVKRAAAVTVRSVTSHFRLEYRLHIS